MADHKGNMEKLKAGVRGIANDMKMVVGVLPSGDEIEIYFRPMTLREKGRIMKSLERDVGDALAETLILRALDQNGEKMYTMAQKADFTRTRGLPEFVENVTKAMADADRDDELPGSPDPEN